MSKLSIAVMLVLLCACSASVAPQDDAVQPNAIIKTVDNRNEALKAEKVKWWYARDPDTSFQLRCEQAQCSIWTLEEQAAGAITIHAHAAIVKENDAYCWDWFEGEASLEADPAVQQEVNVTLSFTGTVCK